MDNNHNKEPLTIIIINMVMDNKETNKQVTNNQDIKLVINNHNMDINKVINNHLDINHQHINNNQRINNHLMGLRLHISSPIMVKEINKDTINTII